MFPEIILWLCTVYFLLADWVEFEQLIDHCICGLFGDQQNHTRTFFWFYPISPANNGFYVRFYYRPQRSWDKVIFTARNEVGARLCFYRCVWFCSQGGSTWPGTPLGPGTPPWDQVHTHPRDQVHPPGPGTTSLDQVHPPGTRYTPFPRDQVHPLPPGTRYTPWDQVHPPWDQVPPQDQVHTPGTRYTPRDQVHPPRTRYTPPKDQVHPPGQVQPPLDQVHPPGTRYTPRDQVHPPPPWTRYTPPLGPERYSLLTGGTHPTGMHSCFSCVYQEFCP